MESICADILVNEKNSTVAPNHRENDVQGIIAGTLRDKIVQTRRMEECASWL